MNKSSQIHNASEAIQELCDLIGDIYTNEDYTTEQAKKYYNELVKRNQLKSGTDPEHIVKPAYANHVCMMAKELAKVIVFMSREGVTEEHVVKRINRVAEMLKIEEEE